MSSVRIWRVVLLTAAAFGAGAFVTWFAINLRRDRILTRISVEVVPGSNLLSATIPPGTYSCGISFEADPLKARADTGGDVGAGSVERMAVRRKGVLIADSGKRSRLVFSVSDASFALTELEVVVTQKCFLHCGPAN